MSRKASRLRRLGASFALDERVQPDRKATFGFGWELAIETLRDDQAEHPVTEEFQPLI